jgi:hypothetical protein
LTTVLAGTLPRIALLRVAATLWHFADGLGDVQLVVQFV